MGEAKREEGVREGRGKEGRGNGGWVRQRGKRE